MVDMNIVIADNIMIHLERKKKKQVDLAEYLNVSRQTVSKMLSGMRTITAPELGRIAEFCGTKMEKLLEIPDYMDEMDMVHAFMGQVNTEEARQSIQDLGAMIDMVLYHHQVMESGTALMTEWEGF